MSCYSKDHLVLFLPFIFVCACWISSWSCKRNTYYLLICFFSPKQSFPCHMTATGSFFVESQLQLISKLEVLHVDQPCLLSRMSSLHISWLYLLHKWLRSKVHFLHPRSHFVPFDESGTPLHIAAKERNKQAIKFLIENGAFLPPDINDNRFNPPLHYCPGLEWAYEIKHKQEEWLSSSGTSCSSEN